MRRPFRMIDAAGKPLEQVHAQQTNTSQEAAGFTLIEVLIAMVLLILVVGTLATATYVGIHIATASNKRITSSVDAGLTTEWFGLDVRSSKSFTAPGTGAAGSCRADPAFNQTGPGVATDLLDLFQPVTNGSNSMMITSYWYGEVGTGNQSKWWLERSNCLGNSKQYFPLARSLSSSTAPTVSLQCGLLSCTNGATVTSVTLQATESDGYSYSLTADPRITATFGPPGGGDETILALGGSGTDISVTGNGHLTATGDLVADGSSNPSISITCNTKPCINAVGNIDTLPIGSAPNWGCSGCSGGGSVPFPIGTVPSPVPDPYAGDSPPGTTGCDPTNYANPCTTYSSQPGPGTWSPGIYTSAISISGNQTWTFKPGTYIFEDGFAISSASATVNMPTGPSSATNGIFIYIGNPATLGNPNPACPASPLPTFSLTGNSNLDLVPFSTTAGNHYANMVLYEQRCTPTPPATLTLTFSGNSVSSIVGGVVYAPTTDIQVGGTNSTWQFSQLICNTVVVSPAKVTLGPPPPP